LPNRQKNKILESQKVPLHNLSLKPAQHVSLVQAWRAAYMRGRAQEPGEALAPNTSQHGHIERRLPALSSSHQRPPSTTFCAETRPEALRPSHRQKNKPVENSA